MRRFIGSDRWGGPEHHICPDHVIPDTALDHRTGTCDDYSAATSSDDGAPGDYSAATSSDDGASDDVNDDYFHHRQHYHDLHYDDDRTAGGLRVRRRHRAPAR